MTNAETKAALSQIAGGQKHMEECPLLLVWCADLARTKKIGERHNYPTDATGFLESFVVSVVDAALEMVGLSDRLETRVGITLGKSRGKVTIDFASVDDLNRILDAMHLRSSA